MITNSPAQGMPLRSAAAARLARPPSCPAVRAVRPLSTNKPSALSGRVTPRLPAIRRRSVASRSVQACAGHPKLWLIPSGHLISVMVLVPGLDRLPNSAIDGMPDNLWSQHTQQIQVCYSETDQSTPFNQFCKKYADGELQTEAMREWAQQAAPPVTSVSLSVPSGAAQPGMAGGMGALGPIWTRSDAEAPTGEKSMGSWTAKVYTEEQQGRLGLDEEGKPAWGKLIGTPGEQAEAAIKMFNPDLTVHVVPDGSMVTFDFREDRVRIFVDTEGNVARAPITG